MPKTRSKKEGSVYQRAADGMWCASVELPSTNGTRRRKVVVAKTKTLALAKLNALKGELRQHGDLPTANQTLATWMDYWFINIKSKTLRPGTMSSYRSKVGYIKDSIGGVRLDKLTPTHVYKLRDHILALGLATSTASQTHSILSNALRYAERDGRVHRNVAKLTDKPRVARTDLGVLSGTDGRRIIDTIAGERLGSRYAAALFTGARQGELIGIEIDRVGEYLDMSWKLERVAWVHGCGQPTGTETFTYGAGERTRDVWPCGKIRGTDCPQRKIDHPGDWEHRHLTGGLYLTRPKSKAGWRIIPLVGPLKVIIERRIEISLTEPNPHGLVWTADPKKTRHGVLLELDGSPIDPRVDSAAFDAILKRAGVPDVRLHDARHTAVDMFYEAGVAEDLIQELIGHSTVAMSRSYKSRGNLAQLSDAMRKQSTRLELPPAAG